MITSHQTLVDLISHSFTAHALHPTKPSKAFRKWDNRTPYATHSIWCAMTLLSETLLPETIREKGSQALILHDTLEDTLQELPKGLDTKVISLVHEMTFSSSTEEMEQIWTKSQEVKLLKLYDKVSNLMDGVWMDPEKLSKYKDYVRKLASEIEVVYGRLNIVKIAETLIKNE